VVERSGQKVLRGREGGVVWDEGGRSGGERKRRGEEERGERRGASRWEEQNRFEPV
jgi:hypothetical protein